MQAMVIVTSGTNCDLELAQAFEDAGASCQTVQLHSILDAPEALDGAELVGLPGGFAYGDAVAAGRIKAALMRERVVPVLSRLLDRGVPMIAPCNGFQTAVQCGLLPGPAPSRPEVALAPNVSGRFEDRWTGVDFPDSRCIWTKDLVEEDGHELPSAHGEGRFVASAETVSRLVDDRQVAVRYQDNFNGSDEAIAGICDPTGLLLGLMPHPERWTRHSQHPVWTRRPASATTTGQRMFRAAVEHAQAALR